MEGVSSHVVGMAYESADGNIDDALDSIIGSEGKVIPDDVQINGIVNNIAPDYSRSVMENVELEETELDDLDDDDIEDIDKTTDPGSSSLSYDYDDDQLIDMAISGIK